MAKGLEALSIEHFDKYICITSSNSPPILGHFWGIPYGQRAIGSPLNT